MTERPIEGDHPDYEPKPGSTKPDQKENDAAKDDPHSAPESGDKT
ncbi:hypothetical protein [Erwinia billingiae]|nr:hypothetical protein [Erwinia billingiae]